MHLFTFYPCHPEKSEMGFHRSGRESRIVKLNILIQVSFENSYVRNYENIEKQEIKLSYELLRARIKINFPPVLDS